jgi:TolB-like protein/Tfp pilus assembly protein PilF
VASKITTFLKELKRRKVYAVAVVYVAAAAGILGIAEPALGEAGWEDIRIPVVALLLIGFPVALVLAWAYEVKPESPPPEQAQRPEPGVSPALRSAVSQTLGSAETRERSVVTSTDPRTSIVVLPFDNMSPDPNDAYFSDGLTEEIIADLSAIRSLRVISRSSAMVFKGTQKDVRTIGRELNVQYVIEGSVRKAGDDLRITAQLIEAQTDTHIWAEKYDGVFGDVFGFQEEVAQAIVEALNLTLSTDEEARLADHPIQDPRALECYLRARQEIWKWTEASLDRAIQQLQLGLELVGENPLILFGLGYTQVQYVNFGLHLGEEIDEALDRAEEYAAKILEIEPSSPNAHCILGMTKYKRGDSGGTVDHFKAALAGDPTNRDALLFLSIIYGNAGRFDEAMRLGEEFLKIEPLDSLGNMLIGWCNLQKGEIETALADYLRVLEMDPENLYNRYVRGWTLALAGRSGEAMEVLEPMASRQPEHFPGWFASLALAALRGDREEVERYASMDFQSAAERDEHWSLFLAHSYALVNENDKAMPWLENAVDRGLINHPFISQQDPLLENLRGDERFERLMERVKHEWENFEV